MPPYTPTADERLNWRTVSFVLENAVFLLIGLQLDWILEDVTESYNKMRLDLKNTKADAVKLEASLKPAQEALVAETDRRYPMKLRLTVRDEDVIADFTSREEIFRLTAYARCAG